LKKQLRCLKCFELRPEDSFKSDGFCSICEIDDEKKQLEKDMAERKEFNLEKRKKQVRKQKQETYKKNHPKTRTKKVVKAKAIRASETKHDRSPMVKDADTAQQELAKRELARRHLLPYTKMFVPGYKAGWVHIDICERLEKFYKEVEEKKSPRLMLFMPPRTGKSEIGSVNFPSWGLGKNPRLEIISTSYALGLAAEFSVKARDRIIHDPRYHTLFPETQVNKNRKNIEHWSTTKGGSYIAAGTGGPIVGKGFHIGIIDDPVKNREEADSETVQKAKWDWYRSAFRTRAAPGAGILVIQTRWSFEDISGKLLRLMEEGGEDAEHWEVVEYPALAEQDEYIDLENREIIRDPYEVQETYRLLRKRHTALHPERYDEKALRVLRNSVGVREWSAQFQQRPLPESGDFFKDEWFQYKKPESFRGMKNVMTGDLALGTKAHNHHSAFAVGALDWEGMLWIREILFGKWSTFELVELILDKQLEYDLALIGIEKGSTLLAIADQMRLRKKERGIFPTFCEELAPITDKRVRARPFQGMMQSGHIFWPTHNPWWMAPAQKQLLQFDAAADDDIVDALAWLARMYPFIAKPKGAKKQRKPKSWKDQLKKIRRQSRSAMSA
jgi:predicted phage terminase large subunit-like protein